MTAINGRLCNGGNNDQRTAWLEWIGGASNNQPTKYWLDRAASLAATDEKNEADGTENAKNGQWAMGEAESDCEPQLFSLWAVTILSKTKISL
jgi:hypothetical protein